MMLVRTRGMQRLIGLIPSELEKKIDVTFDDLRGEVEPLIGAKVEHVNWFSTYRVHHRVAEHLRVGRTFLAGDAGHIHSPTGGQGMNTGIGDAINLGWKLADVMRGRASPVILDTYEAERLPFAKRLVATTDRVFEAIISGGFKGELVRNWLAPAVINIATRLPATKHQAFRTVSQTAIGYRDSVLSEGDAGLHGGDRLPWIKPHDGDEDNFKPLQSLDWQVHVYGRPEVGLDEACAKLRVALHVVPWSNGARDVGLLRDAAYLVRPDGYIALAAHADCAIKLKGYTTRLGLNFA